MSLAAQVEQAARAAAAAVLDEALVRIDSLEKEIAKLKDQLSQPSPAKPTAASYDKPVRAGTARAAGTAKDTGKASG